MTRQVLLDTSLLIAALDDRGDTSEEKRQQAKRRLRELLADENTALAISPLIRYEVLRGASWHEQERYDKLRDSLDGFTEFEISRDIAELATKLYRFDKQQADKKGAQPNLEKRKFDVFHYATAKCLDLSIETQDGDFDKLEALYAETKQAPLVTYHKP